ncbi:hypothetical protein Dimus_022555, partial [Dionaea muscipula]
LPIARQILGLWPGHARVDHAQAHLLSARPSTESGVPTLRIDRKCSKEGGVARSQADLHDEGGLPGEGDLPGEGRAWICSAMEGGDARWFTFCPVMEELPGGGGDLPGKSAQRRWVPKTCPVVGGDRGLDLLARSDQRICSDRARSVLSRS